MVPTVIKSVTFAYQFQAYICHYKLTITFVWAPNNIYNMKTLRELSTRLLLFPLERTFNFLLSAGGLQERN